MLHRTRHIVVVLAFAPLAYAQMMLSPEALWRQATIYRDAFGVPHVRADNLFAMAFAFGYAQADDHVEAMLKAYRIANGRAAEVFGEEFAASDEFSLKMGHALLAQQALANADPITRDLCNGFALGVNAWLVDHPSLAPDWAGGARPEDVLALLHCYLMSFAPFDLPNTYARAPAALSGNAWAVSPARSKSGGAILAMNPHTDYRGPFQWCEAHLIAGDLNVYGATLFGLPVILQGHNGKLGWALTPNQPDTADVFVEPAPRPPAAAGRAARKPGSIGPAPPIPIETEQYLEMVANAKTYHVRTASGLEERQVPYLDTPRGPVIGRHEGRFCTYSIGGYRDFGAVRQFFEMARADNLDAFKLALAMQQLPCFHVLYADRAGNIMYVYNAKVVHKYDPPRHGGPVATPPPRTATDREIVDWAQPVPGGDPRFAWGNVVPLDQLPWLVNPESGYLQACGNPPWSVTERAGFDPARWPRWLCNEADSFRAKRARRLLAFGPRSFEDAQAMLFDVLVPAGMFAAPKLLEAADSNPTWVAAAHPDLPAALDLLRNWNYVAETNSPGMTFFHVWWYAMRLNAAPAAAGMSDYAILEALNQNSTDVQRVAVAAADQAVRLMRSEFDSVKVPWGQVHAYVRAGRKIPAPGAVSGDPIFVASDWDFIEGAWRVNYGYAFAMVVLFGETTRAASLVPFGSSENPGSPHYEDQVRLLEERRLKPTHFDPAEVERYAATAWGSNVVVAPRGVPALFRVQTARPVTVGTETKTEPPAPIPAGLAPFTLFAKLSIAPTDEPCEIEARAQIPPEVCAAEHLPTLAFFSYDGLRGWRALEAQELDPAARTFIARDRRTHWYAVLGPAAHQIQSDPETAVLVARTIPEAPPVPSTPPLETAVSLAPDSAPAPPDGPAAAPAAAGGAETSPVPAPPTPSSAVLGSAPAPDAKGVKRGAIAWGRKMQMRPPGVEGLLEISASDSIGVRLATSSEPPHPLPEGLAAFTGFVTAECEAAVDGLDVKVSLRPAPETCDPTALPKLSMYALDRDHGWQPLPDQTSDAATRTFAARDTALRTYALLGPRELLVRPPAPPAQ